RNARRRQVRDGNRRVLDRSRHAKWATAIHDLFDTRGRWYLADRRDVATETRMTRWFVVLLLMLPLGGCDGAPSVLFGKRIDGVVLDAETGQPVPDAYV